MGEVLVEVEEAYLAEVVEVHRVVGVEGEYLAEVVECLEEALLGEGAAYPEEVVEEVVVQYLVVEVL